MGPDDVVVSMYNHCGSGDAVFRTFYVDEKDEEPVVLVIIDSCATLHFRDPTVLARFAAAVTRAQGQLDAACQRRAQSPLPVDHPDVDVPTGSLVAVPITTGVA